MKTSLPDAFASGSLARVIEFHLSPSNTNDIDPSLSAHSILIGARASNVAIKHVSTTNSYGMFRRTMQSKDNVLEYDSYTTITPHITKISEESKR